MYYKASTFYCLVRNCTSKGVSNSDEEMAHLKLQSQYKVPTKSKISLAYLI